MRIAFQMSVDPDVIEEYESRHSSIWPALEQTLLEHGVLSYSIFVDDRTGTLFAYAEVNSEDEWIRIASTDVCQKWWAYMAPLMVINSDNSPASCSLREVFHIESKHSPQQ